MKEIIIGSSLLIVAIALLRIALKEKLSRRAQYALWALVLVRLLIPVNLPVAWQTVDHLPTYSTASVQPAPVATSINEMSPSATVSAQPEDYTAVEISKAALSDEAILKTVWVAGMIAVGGYFALINARFYLKLRRRRLPWLTEKGKRRIWLVEEGLSSPCAFLGAIYLTPSAVRTEESLTHVLRHEETHLHHLDSLWALLRCVCLAVYWFDPLVWLAARLSEIDAEMACDEGALQRLNEEDRLAYGETLISLIPVSGGKTAPFVAATSLASGKKQLAERVRRIAQRPHTYAALALIAFVLVGFCTVCTFVRAENPRFYGEGRELTEAEIAKVNQAFEQLVSVETDKGEVLYVSPVCGFFASYYSDVREMDFGEFIAYFPSRAGDAEVDEKEFQKVRRDAQFPFRAETLENMMVPVHRHRRDYVDEILMKYAGISTAELDTACGMIYLDETDSWYNFTSDFGAGFFNCFGGTVYDNAAVLCGNRMEDGSYDQLVLEKNGEKWLIKSFTKANE